MRFARASHRDQLKPFAPQRSVLSMATAPHAFRTMTAILQSRAAHRRIASASASPREP
jgi:hypothetical protein